MNRFRILFLAILASVAPFMLAGCSESVETSAPPVAPATGRVLTLGDIDPDEPAKRVRRLQPLADFLAARLAHRDIGRGRVVVARDMDEMSALIADGTVDLLLDSAYPIATVNSHGASEVLLQRNAKNDPLYWSVFIALKSSPLNTIQDLTGRIAIFQEPHSTSGYVLPATMLINNDISIVPVAGPRSIVSDNQIGCLFSGDEENTVEMVLNGIAPVGAISNQDYRELPAAIQQRLRIVGRTDSVPRQLVAVRSGLESDLIDELRTLLLELSTEDREALRAKDEPYGWTWIFEELSVASREAVSALSKNASRLPVCGAIR